jgi:hypothetical protein
LPKNFLIIWNSSSTLSSSDVDPGKRRGDDVNG